MQPLFLSLRRPTAHQRPTGEGAAWSAPPPPAQGQAEEETRQRSRRAPWRDTPLGMSRGDHPEGVAAVQGDCLIRMLLEKNGLQFSNGDYTLEIGKRVVIRVDTIENSVIRRSIDIRKTLYNENIDCNYTGVVAVFAPTRFAKCILTPEYRVRFAER